MQYENEPQYRWPVMILIACNVVALLLIWEAYV
jgi:hypothetical protein